MSKIADDPRIDPRIKALFGALEFPAPQGASSREELLAAANTPEAVAASQMLRSFMDSADSEDVAPSTGLTITTHTLASEPDGNTINIQFIRPQSNEPLPCVYYIHGGGMTTMSCFYGNYKAWGRMIAQQGVAVAMVDFRNALTSVIRAGDRAVPRRPERLRLRPDMGVRQQRETRHRPRRDHRCR